MEHQFPISNDPGGMTLTAIHHLSWMMKESLR